MRLQVAVSCTCLNGVKSFGKLEIKQNLNVEFQTRLKIAKNGLVHAKPLNITKPEQYMKGKKFLWNFI